MKTALKEWAAVCRALEAGDSALILRRGGIAEPDGLFLAEHPAFLLLPTRFHQEPAALVPSARPHLDAARAAEPPQGTLRLASLARVAAVHAVRDARSLAALRPFHVWSDDVARERLEREGEGALVAMVVRVERMAKPVELAMRKDYGGCKSWVELAEDIDVREARQVMGDRDFASVESAIRKALGP